MVGVSKALEWAYSGKVFDAEEALEGGLVRSIHEPEDLMTQEYAEKIATGSGLNEEEKDAILTQSPLTLINRVSSR